MTENVSEPTVAAFGLEPDCRPPITFAEFLRQAAKDDSLFDSFWQRARRNIIKTGYVHPAGESGKDQPDPYLVSLAAEGMRSYNAFAGIEGCEYTVAELTQNEPIERILCFIGPPGSGKTLFLQRYLDQVMGEFFYMIHGCPNNCRPEWLLTLMAEEQVGKLPKDFGQTESLLALRASKRTIEPCDHCQQTIFGTRDEPKSDPRLDLVKIQPVRLAVRSGHGAAFWTPSADRGAPSWEDSAQQGTHVLLVGQPFGETGYSSSGQTARYHAMLEAVQGRRKLPNGKPFGSQVIWETNTGGHAKYMSNVDDQDRGAYFRRIDYIRVPYLAAVSRERRAYETRVEEMIQKFGVPVVFDPLVLDAIAAFAVGSRLNMDLKSEGLGVTLPTLTRIGRVRIQDGDLTHLELMFGKAFKQRTEQPNYTPAPDHNFELKEMRQLLRIAAGQEDCFGGLSESFMLEDIIEPLTSAGQFYAERRVTFFAAVQFVQAAIVRQQNKDTKAPQKQQDMYKDCLRQLELCKQATEPNALMESWYRWRLNHLVQSAFFNVDEPGLSVDLDDLHDTRFVDYFNLACALGGGQPEYEDSSGDTVKITEERIREIAGPVENLMGLTDPKAVAEFRSNLSSRMTRYMRAYFDRLGIPAAQAQRMRPTWDGLPELKRAIAILVAEECFRIIGICLDEDDMKRQDPEKHRVLKPADAARRRRAAEKNLLARGFSDASLKQMFTYYRANFMWRTFNSGGHDAYTY